MKKNPFRERISFAKLEDVVDLPDLVEVQRRSYEWFLQRNVESGKRRGQGLQAVFKEIFPIRAPYEKNLELDFVSYSIGEPKYSEHECLEKDLTFAAPLRVHVRLIYRKVGEIREQEVYMGDLPMMTARGTFIINGAERVIVHQIHRSPGVVFDHDEGKTHPSGKRLYSAKILPYRGAWIEMDYEVGEILDIRLDRKKKLPVTALLRVLGLSTNDEILDRFYGRFKTSLRLAEASGEDAHPLVGKVLAESLVEIREGEDGKKGPHPVAWSGDIVTEKTLGEILGFADRNGRKALPIFDIPEEEDTTILRTIEQDDTHSEAEAVVDVIEALRPGDAPPLETAREEFKKTFFDPRRYDLGEVGRYQVNRKLGRDMKNAPSDTVLRPDDILSTVEKLIDLNQTQGATDDTDHLANRRVRSVGELLQNEFRKGLSRMEKVVIQRMTTQDEDTMTPQELINIKPVSAIVKEFFGASQLSQYMDQTNPLSQLTHKRRLSALGPGGLKRERALSDVRDVHRTHYGRVCPIETPEGPNIGLIVSLATYGRVNDYGFLEAPYRKVKNGKVTEEIVFLTADEEDQVTIAQATTEVSPSGAFVESKILSRKRDKTLFAEPGDVEYMDVSPQQIVSVSTALIPFLENDDANRALMGSNMQRQAVPLLKPAAPLVGTGLEYRAALDSGALVIAEEDGEVVEVSGNRILVKEKGTSTPRIYPLHKFQRSNQSTSINQSPIVRRGDKVKTGDPLADGAATDKGDIALGKNCLIAFMSWEGYNYEDAVIMSERLIAEDVFTSIHIEKFESTARDTKLGKEQITREIPNVSEESLEHLDENGISKVGAWVKSGDILVGKVTPKGSPDLSPEHRLLYSIFGEKARDVRDTSLRVPHGTEGVVTDVKIFDRAAGDDLPPGVEKMVKVFVAARRKIQVGDKIAGRHGNKGVVSRIVPVADMPHLEDGTPIDVVLNPLGVPSRMNIGQILETHLGWAAQKLGIHVATPVFSGAKENEIRALMADAGLPPSGKSRLVDGRTGEFFDNEVTVGVMYILKLNHLVDDKMHARSTGPYSLVTQQPLGGKAQFGGQRFGEMEVWALQGYGAAHLLQEMLTVKSDDVTGRAKIFEAIVKGENAAAPGIPESFNVLVRELQGLCMDIEVTAESGEIITLRESDEDDYAYGGAAMALSRRS